LIVGWKEQLRAVGDEVAKDWTSDNGEDNGAEKKKIEGLLPSSKTIWDERGLGGRQFWLREQGWKSILGQKKVGGKEVITKLV